MTCSITTVGTVAFAVATFGVAETGRALTCAGDLNGDGVVDGADLGQLLGQWGDCPGCAADLNGDDAVDGADLGSLLGAWGDCPLFEYNPPYEDPEVEQIALEMLGPEGELLPDQDDLERIDADLDAIRKFEPALESETHSAAWPADELLVSLFPDEPQDELECLNEFYQVTDMELISDSLDLYLFTFAGNINVEALAQIYSDAQGVDFAEPNGLIGGENFWEPMPMEGGVWQWEVDDGFHDCFDGCDCHNLYVFETDAEGNVELISFQQQGPSYCDFD